MARQSKLSVNFLGVRYTAYPAIVSTLDLDEMSDAIREEAAREDGDVMRLSRRLAFNYITDLHADGQEVEPEDVHYLVIEQLVNKAQDFFYARQPEVLDEVWQLGVKDEPLNDYWAQVSHVCKTYGWTYKQFLDAPVAMINRGQKLLAEYIEGQKFGAKNGE